MNDSSQSPIGILKRGLLLVVLLGFGLWPSPSDASDDQPFYTGVYLYDYQFRATAEHQGEDYFEFLEKHLQILSNHGVNVVHLAVSYPEEFGAHLQLFKKYGIKLLPQLDFVYFVPTETDAAMSLRATGAAAFINTYISDPGVLAWSVKEEVAQQDVARLGQFYTQILAGAPGAKLFTLHNAIGAATEQPEPYPVLSGTDRYAFWWEFSGGGYLASPAYALDWTRKQAAVYYEESARRGADFMLVVTQGGMLMPQWANTLAKTPREVAYPLVEDEQVAMQKKILSFADEGRMGWRKFSTEEGDFYNVWKYYRAPKNTMKAMAWISVLEGAKYFLTWHYEPYDPDKSQPTLEAASRSGAGEIQYVTLAGRPDMENPQLEEFGEAAGEIRAYEGIITQMTKLPTCPIEAADAQVHARAFRFPGLNGTVVVLHNSNVGTWPGESRYLFQEDDPIQIDDSGNLVGYVPFSEAMEVRFTRTDENSEHHVYDLKTGKEILDVGGYSTSVLPGSGRLLYVGTFDDGEQLSTLVK